MRITDDTRYPHPVLSDASGDYSEGDFHVSYQCREVFTTGKVTLSHEVSLDQPDVLELVESGAACVGAIVRCRDTYYCELHKMTWPAGAIEFREGLLLNRVYVRPVIWLARELADWKPAHLNPEFAAPLALGKGDIIAIAPESRLTVGRAKLAPLESIFTMKVADELEPHAIRVDLHNDKITILAGKAAYAAVNELRASRSGRAVAVAAVYMPVVMEVLDQMGDNTFEDQRWSRPFLAKCDAMGINPENANLLEDAQRLLDHPLAGLEPPREAAP